MSKKFIIVGGGIGGLACALVLARAGHTVEVLEQSEAFGEIGAGIQIGPNAFRVFEHLGLTQKINAVAYFPAALQMRDIRTGELVVRAAVGETARAAYGYAYGVIYRADLHQVLLSDCMKLPNIQLRTRCKVTRFEQDSAGVQVHLAGSGVMHADALVGADGLWSKIREAIVGDGKPRVSGHIAYRAVLPMEQVPQELYSPDVVLWGGEKTHLVHYPLRRGELFNLVAVFHSSKFDEGWNTFGDPVELHERFALAAPQVRALLEKIETWKMWVLCDREPVSTWSQGRVTLLGDAAHPMLQYLAQGAAMALEDAVVLGAALAHTEVDVVGAFAAYEKARYLRTARVQLTARLYGDIYHASGAARVLRNTLFQSGQESVGFTGLGWLYKGVDSQQLFQTNPTSL